MARGRVGANGWYVLYDGEIVKALPHDRLTSR